MVINGLAHHVFWSVTKMVNVKNELLKNSYPISLFPTFIKSINMYLS